ncbi:hypothetical protein BC938DRAFT_470861 [Jimgerdemannia flammicorona]|uniref:Uncharacterized protein n=1 Tax=Jimgerdemannia flammicorona TaxID=994334 RepID=A0A433Q9D4_9FUNG|nr:hypothetical protein BC938DRAFT_470861 [Jimgerdemannia flammicorona]
MTNAVYPSSFYPTLFLPKSAHLTIVRSTDPDTTAIQLLSKVTLSTRELSDRLTYALGVDSTTFAVSARLTTPDTLNWNECICIDVTLIIPQRWDGANRLAFDLHGWEVDLHDLVDSPDSGNGGLDFDIIDIRTTHRPLTIMGHLAARSILNLAASDSPVRSKGTLRSGDILTVKSSNAPLDLNSTFGRIVSLSTTNGRVRGRHEAKDTLRIETSNGPVDLLRASAPAVRIKTTNGGIACREVRVGRVVEVATSNGGVDLEVGWLGAEPQGAEGVKVLVRTSNEPAKVLLEEWEWDWKELVYLVGVFAFLSFLGRKPMVRTLALTNPPTAISQPDSFKGSFIVATTQDTATIGYATDPFNSSDSLEPHPRSYPPAYPGTPPKPLASGELHYNVSRSNMKQGWKGRNEDDLYRGEIDVKTKNAKASVWFVREVSEEEESVS